MLASALGCSTARRETIERKIALREATAAEFSAVALQSYTQKWKRLRTAAVTAKARNDAFIRSLHETQKQVNDAYVKQKNDLTSSSAMLEREKRKYFQKIEAVYPAWQEKLQEMRLHKLKALEEKKRAVEKRRYLAKKVSGAPFSCVIGGCCSLFTISRCDINADIRERAVVGRLDSADGTQDVSYWMRGSCSEWLTPCFSQSHEIELSENLERNEAYEREMLRKQSALQGTIGIETRNVHRMSDSLLCTFRQQPAWITPFASMQSEQDHIWLSKRKSRSGKLQSSTKTLLVSQSMLFSVSSRFCLKRFVVAFVRRETIRDILAKKCASCVEAGKQVRQPHR